MNILISYDEKIFTLAHGLTGRWFIVDKLIIFLSLYLIYLIPLLLVVGWFWSAQTKRVAFRAALAGIVAWWGISKPIAAIVGRVRPSLALLGQKELLFHRPDNSFPSDHSAFVFAIATMVRLSGHRKLGNFLFVAAFLIAISRVFAGVHFPLDVLGGAVIGVLVGLSVWLIRKKIDKILTEPFVKIMAKVKL